MIKKTFKVPIYSQFKMTIIISDSIVDIVQDMTKEVDYSFDGMFFCKTNRSSELYIGLDKSKLNMGLISHECFHATAYILNYLDTPLSNDTEEVYAYLMQYFIDQIDDLLKKNKIVV